MGIVTFGHIAQTFFADLSPARQDQALKAVVQALADQLETTVSGLVLHLDEQAPHAHFQLVGYDLKGQPISQTARRQTLRDLQTVAAEVMQRFDERFERGFSREQRKEAGASDEELRNKSVADLHRTQAVDLEVARLKLAELRAKIEKNGKRILAPTYHPVS